MAKRFFFVSAGILCLTLAYHFGAQNATAQAPGNSVVAMIPFNGGARVAAVVTSNGDIYATNISNLDGPWMMTGNVFYGSGPTQSQGETFGGVKSKYR